MKKIILSFFVTTSLFACPQGYELSHPVSIPVGLSASQVTEEEFMRISTELEELYIPEVQKLGGRLKVYKEWGSSTVNAYAQREGREWKVIMLGGIARHKHMTADGYALVVCHEIGHHLGGEPRYDGLDIGWATSEGQSDYYSTLSCLRKYWQNDNNEAAIRDQVIPPKLYDECDGEALCIRSGMAGLSVSHVFASLAWSWTKPKFETPDKKEVKETYMAHPKPQCRLDTYLQGAITGARPRCWYKPTL